MARRDIAGSVYPDQAGTSCFDTAQCVGVAGAAFDVAAAGDDRAGTIVLVPATAGVALDDAAAAGTSALVVAGAGAGAAGCPLLLFDGRMAAGTAGDPLTRVSAVQWKYAHAASPTSTSSTTRRPAREGAGAAVATASGVIGMKDSGSFDAGGSGGGLMSESSCPESPLSKAGTVVSGPSGSVGTTGSGGGIAWCASSPLTASSGSSAVSPKSFHVSAGGGVVAAGDSSSSALPGSS